MNEIINLPCVEAKAEPKRILSVVTHLMDDGTVQFEAKGSMKMEDLMKFMTFPLMNET